MAKREHYIEFAKGQVKGRKPRFAYMIESLLRSRESAGLETGIHRPDEDVNMYLTGLLCRYADSLPSEEGAQRIIPYDTDLFESISGTVDTRAKYTIYRFNADHLLISLGIFGNAWWRNASQTAFKWVPSRRESIARGKSYYGKAATYATRLEEKKKGLDHLLGKLEVGFEEYLMILETMRSDYFRMLRSFSKGEWHHLCQELGISPDLPPAGAPE